jgi:hypothetical protein
MRLPFGKKDKTAQPRVAQPMVERQDPGPAPGPAEGPGFAGYSGTGRKKDNMPRRFRFVRPDGQPQAPKGSERRSRGFFS